MRYTSTESQCSQEKMMHYARRGCICSIRVHQVASGTSSFSPWWHSIFVAPILIAFGREAGRTAASIRMSTVVSSSRSDPEKMTVRGHDEHLTLTILLGVLEKIHHCFSGKNTRVDRFRKVGVASDRALIFTRDAELTGDSAGFVCVGRFCRLEERRSTGAERSRPGEGFRRGSQQEQGAKRKVGHHSFWQNGRGEVSNSAFSARKGSVALGSTSRDETDVCF